MDLERRSAGEGVSATTRHGEEWRRDVPDALAAEGGEICGDTRSLEVDDTSEGLRKEKKVSRSAFSEDGAAQAPRARTTPLLGSKTRRKGAPAPTTLDTRANGTDG